MRRGPKSDPEEDGSPPKKRAPRKRAKSDPEEDGSPPKKRAPRKRAKNDPGSAPADKESAGKDGDDAKGKDDLGCGGWCVVLAVLAAVVLVAWYLLTSFPRTSFWIAAPIIGWYTVSGIGFKGGKAVLSILLLTGIVWWGLWAHSVL